MPLAGQVHADLVGAAGLDGHLQQRHRGQAPLRPGGCRAAHLDQGDGAHAVRVVGGGHAHAAFASTGGAFRPRLQVFVQRQVDDLLVGRPGARDQRQIGFARLALAELVLQVSER